MTACAPIARLPSPDEFWAGVFCVRCQVEALPVRLGVWRCPACGVVGPPIEGGEVRRFSFREFVPVPEASGD